ncbi:hypothetical protein B296_00012446 [Ensete ventricosum]|uniref:Uncharacterized protein n=1 Tax=Ensete ventricosum TaxID=4639 RepID=A0A427A0J4_ENSVE|nr:hypothetical protein B296_00012446 [Ensete ventricosum]
MWPSPLRASATFACRRLLPLRPPSTVVSGCDTTSSCNYRQWPWETIALRALPPLRAAAAAFTSGLLLRVRGHRFVAVLPQPASYSRIAIVRIYYLCVVVAMQ